MTDPTNINSRRTFQESRLDVALSSRAYALDLPASIERRLVACAQRIERDDRRAGVAEEDRIDAVRDFDHVLIAMIDRGLDESELEAGLIHDPMTGRLSVRAPGEIVTYPARGTRLDSPPRREENVADDAWWIGVVVLIFLIGLAFAIDVTLIVRGGLLS